MSFFPTKSSLGSSAIKNGVSDLDNILYDRVALMVFRLQLYIFLLNSKSPK